MIICKFVVLLCAAFRNFCVPRTASTTVQNIEKLS